MRVLVAAGVVALVATGVSAAEPDRGAFISGNKLLTLCRQGKSGHEASKWSCSSYVQGVADAAITFDRGRNAVNMCIPLGVASEQIQDVTVQWLEAHPERRHVRASDLIAAALSEAFPCQRRG